MIQLSSTLLNRPIMSLQTGTQVGLALRPVMNPNNLKIEGWYSRDDFSKNELILPSGEVREIGKVGIIVNDHEAMTEPKDLVRLKTVLDINYELTGKKVMTDLGATIGKVNDFSYDPKSMFVQKLYVSAKGLGGFTGPEKIISRQQIVKITDHEIVVRDSTIKAPFMKRILNPLRQASPSTGSVSADTKNPSA